jgi:hypothetical protein
MNSLYKITAEYLENVKLLESMDFDDETKKDTLESLQGDFENKAISIGFVQKTLSAHVGAIDAALKDMQERKRVVENKLNRLNEYLLENMQQAGITSISCPQFDIKLKNNPVKVDIYEAGLLPSEFMRQPELPPPQPDKKAIKEAIEAGKEVQGARLIKTQRLEIK